MLQSKMLEKRFWQTLLNLRTEKVSAADTTALGLLAEKAKGQGASDFAALIEHIILGDDNGITATEKSELIAMFVDEDSFYCWK